MYTGKDCYDEIIHIYNELRKKYKTGDLIEIHDAQEKYNWFYMKYDDVNKVYIYDESLVSKYMDIYKNKMDQDDFYMDFFKDYSTKSIKIFLKNGNVEVATYHPDCRLIIIEKKVAEEFNKIRQDIYSIFDIEEEAYFEVGKYPKEVV